MSNPSFYVTIGQNSFLATDFIAQIKSSIPQPYESISWDNKSNNFANISDLLMTYPMLGTHRLIIIDQIKELDEKEQAQLLSYIDAPTPQTTVIWRTTKIDQRKKFSKTLLSKATTIKLESPKLSEMSVWVDKLCQKRNIQIARDAKPFLIDYIGTDIGRLDQEIEKLCLFVHPSTVITKDAVMNLVLKLSGDDIFATTDAIWDQNQKKAFENLHFLFESGVSPFAITSMLVRHVRILFKIQNAMRKRVPQNQWASYIGIPPFTIAKYKQQSQKLTTNACAKALSVLSQLDTDMKSTGIGQNRLLERALISLMHHS
ncbi:MAG: DNA polymerase III subunit delta [Bdellovibrionales bacterium]|nr:DNA polymerase III subunit delta [Bdellovibrionales bacterium]